MRGWFRFSLFVTEFGALEGIRLNQSCVIGPFVGLASLRRNDLKWRFAVKH